MKSKITFYFILLLFSSCSILEKTEIQKRRYRPGFNISFASGNAVQKKIQKSLLDKNLEKTLPVGNTVVQLANNVNTIERPKEQNAIGHFFNDSAPLTSKIKTFAVEINNSLPSLSLFKGRSSVCSTQKTSGIKDCGNGCGNLIVDIAVVVVALIVVVIFPGIDPKVAELIAVGVLIVAAIILILLFRHHNSSR